MSAASPSSPVRRDLDDYDVIVVGSGVAGMSVALGLAGRRNVALITSGVLAGGSTRWAQGGLAAAIAADDQPSLHAEDTMVAGAGACDPLAVEVLTRSAPAALDKLIKYGARFDHTADGALALTREGGHRRRRVVHAGGDATGAEVSRCLEAALRLAGVEVLEHRSVTDLLVADGATGRQACGVITTRGVLTSRAVVLATGGVGGLYVTTTNPSDVTGEGLGLALRAGASLVDVEFVQFHPTALRVAATGQVPLITEALRGEGAVLRDGTGELVMAGRHPMADLAPRDVVARRIDEVLAASSDARVCLDATDVADVRDRFPTVAAACDAAGVDLTTQPIPVVPAQHYLCGGVRADPWGATDVAGLYAVGEVAATGVHGANRLASNSLVEGMVFARRLAIRLAADLPVRRPVVAPASMTPPISDSDLDALRTAMSAGAGIRRSADGLLAAQATLGTIGETNRSMAARAIVAAALARRESRGCHWRIDRPDIGRGDLRHLAIRLDDDGVPAANVTVELVRSAS